MTGRYDGNDIMSVGSQIVKKRYPKNIEYDNINVNKLNSYLKDA